MTPNAWLFFGTCITALATLGGAGFTGWNARSAAKSKSSVDEKANELETLRRIIAEQNEFIGRVQGWHDECEDRCSECVKANSELKADNRRLTSRVCALEDTVRLLSDAVEGGPDG